MKLIKLLLEYDKENAFKDVEQKCFSEKDLLEYLNNIVTYSTLSNKQKEEINKLVKEKNKEKDDLGKMMNPNRDRNKPHINTKTAKIVTDSGKLDDIEIVLAEFKNKINEEPKYIFSENDKIIKSSDEKSFTINIGIPSIYGIYYNAKDEEFKTINTCPGAGSCKLHCYTLRGNYVVSDDVFLKQTRILSLLINNPGRFISRAANEIYQIYKNKIRTDFNNDDKDVKMSIRWNDAGDIFSKTYLEIIDDISKELERIYKIKNTNNYLYTKSGEIVKPNLYPNVNIFYSMNNATEKSKEQIKNYADEGHTVKLSFTINKNIVTDYFDTKNKVWKKQSTEEQPTEEQPTEEKPTKETINKISANIIKYLGDESINRRYAKFYVSEYQKATGGLILVKELKEIVDGGVPIYNVLVLPGDSDIAAQRKDVKNIFLVYH